MGNNSEEYNGHANYETWLAALHIDNTRDYYFRVRGVLDDLKLKEAPASEIMEAVEMEYRKLLEEIVESCRDKVPGIISDYLTHLLGTVDYVELARDLLDDDGIKTDVRE